MGSDCRNNTDWRCRPWEAGLTWADLGQNGSYKNKLRLMIRVKRHLPKPRSVNNFSVPLSMGRRGPSLFWQELLSSQGWFSKREGKWGGGNIVEHRFKPNRMWRSPALHAERARCSPSTSRQNRERRSWQTLSASQCWQYWATQTKGSTQQQLSLFWYNEITPHWTVLLRQCCQQTSENNMSVRTGGEAAAARAPPPRSVAGLRELSDISCKSHHEPSSLGLATERWKRNRFHPDSPFSGGERFPMNRHPFLTGSGLDFVLQQLLNHVWF